MDNPLISRAISILPDQITAVINKYLPGRSIKSVTDRGIWIRHSFRIELDNDHTVWLKVDDGPEAEGCSEKEAFICNLSGYGGCQPDEKRLAYYRLISSVDGALGNYMAPPGVDDSQWKRNAAAMLPVLIDELENLGRHK